MGPGVVLDFRHANDRAPITGEDLEKAQPRIEEGDILIINTGRHKRFGTMEYGTLHPGLDGVAVETFLLEKKIKMIGMDTICVEPGSEQDHWDHPLHRVCLIENEILLIENLGGEIDEVTGKRCYIMALPVRLKADSGPARVIALA
jgi:kynurenine formamidase